MTGSSSDVQPLSVGTMTLWRVPPLRVNSNDKAMEIYLTRLAIAVLCPQIWPLEGEFDDVDLSAPIVREAWERCRAGPGRTGIHFVAIDYGRLGNRAGPGDNLRDANHERTDWTCHGLWCDDAGLPTNARGRHGTQRRVRVVLADLGSAADLCMHRHVCDHNLAGIAHKGGAELPERV